MKQPSARLAELDLSEAKRIVERAALSGSERDVLLGVIEMLVLVLRMLEMKRVTLARLRKMIFGARTEKTSQVCGDEQHEKNHTEEAKALAAGDKPKRKGHGRNPASRYPGATKNSIRHPTLRAGDRCPSCQRGTLGSRPPVKQNRLRGQAPIAAEQDELERLRCNTCGEVFTARAPAGIGQQLKYAVTVAVMIALLRYGYGLPFHRLAQLQAGFGIPLPAATQWDVLCRHLAGPAAAYNESCTMTTRP
jgi:transposase